MSTPTPPAAPPRRRRTLTVVAAAVASVVVVATAVSWVVLRGDDRPRAEVGQQVVTTDGVPIAGVPVDFRLPTGRFRVVLAPGRVEMPPPCCTDSPADLRAPEDGGFVGVEVAVDELDPLGGAVVVPGEPDVEPTYTLLVGKEYLPDVTVEEYPLPVFDREPGSAVIPAPVRAWVAVDGVPAIDELAVRVDYDGVAQVARARNAAIDRGGADGLYLTVPRRPLDLDCADARVPGGLRLGSNLDCRLSLATTPYVTGPGWAGEGQQWLAVTATVPTSVVVVRGSGGDLDRDRLDEPEVRVTLDGAEVARTVDDRTGSTTSYLRVPDDRAPRPEDVAIEATYGVAPDGLTVTWGPGEVR